MYNSQQFVKIAGRETDRLHRGVFSYITRIIQPFFQFFRLPYLGFKVRTPDLPLVRFADIFQKGN